MPPANTNLKMMIDIDILFAWGGVTKCYQKGEVIFYEEDMPRFYHQILSGQVRMYHINEEGREFSQGTFGIGQSFGEPPIFVGKPYPAMAQAMVDTVTIRLGRETFLKIVEEYPAIKTAFLQLMAERVYHKAVKASSLVNNPPEVRILGFLQQLKHGKPPDGRALVPYTRQEIANATGLRVETVIRTLRKMAEAGQVEIRNRKLYF